MRSRRPFIILATVTSALALAIGAGSTPADAADDDDDGVASLGTAPESSEPSSSVGDEPPSTDPEQAMLDYVECMRDHGIDMPDPQLDADGGMLVQVTEENDGSGPPDFEELEEAEEQCQPLMQAALGDIELDPELEAERREHLLAFAECMREHGIDMPDPQFGDNGQVSIMIGDPGGEGPPPDDEEFLAASEACGQEGGMIAVGGTSAGGPPDRPTTEDE